MNRCCKGACPGYSEIPIVWVRPRGNFVKMNNLKQPGVTVGTSGCLISIRLRPKTLFREGEAPAEPLSLPFNAAQQELRPPLESKKGVSGRSLVPGPELQFTVTLYCLQGVRQ